MIINEKLYNDLLLDSHRELAIQSLKTLNKFENALIIANIRWKTYFVFEIEIILDEWRRELKPNKENNNSGYVYFTEMYNFFNFKLIENDNTTYNNFTYYDVKILKNDKLFDCEVTKLRADGTLVESLIKRVDTCRWF